MNPAKLAGKARTHLQTRLTHSAVNRSIRAMAGQVHAHSPQAAGAPVMFFDASTRLSGVSLNAGFARLSSWSLSLQGVPVMHFVCQRGMTQCVLGTDRSTAGKNPPCQSCMAQSRALFGDEAQIPFEFQPSDEFDQALTGLDLDELSSLEYQGVPLGSLVLPSVRWILRRHHLEGDAPTLRILREYLRSAWSLQRSFSAALDETKPQAVVVFNGMQYPEATARWTARQRGLPVYSHEVGLRPLSAFFTAGDATAYPLTLPQDFKLDAEQNSRLDQYLSRRFQGDFHMAGVQFWPEMSQLDPEFVRLSRQFTAVVPVFTNVIFDTSQPHANVLFEDMFVWLDEILQAAARHPEVLFVIRAHPDEARKGKASEETVSHWAESRRVQSLPNVRFIPPTEFFSSYDLIRLSKLVLIYNSTIGLEASILGRPVLAAGKSRFSSADAVLFPSSRQSYQSQLESFLSAAEIQVPPRFAENARRFLYWQLYRSSLNFAAFLEPDGLWPGYVRLKDFGWQQLLPENSAALRAISDGILRGGDFMLREGEE